MRPHNFSLRRWFFLCAALTQMAGPLTLQSHAQDSDGKLPPAQPADSVTTTTGSVTTTVNEARRQAEILHSTLHSSLRVIHDRYYKEDEGLPIPAAILGEVFKDVEGEQKVKLRWLAVEGLAMNSDHRPADEFERQAVEKLKSGERSHENTTDGIYRRAAPITLSSHCLKCHMPDRKSTRDRVAGLIISIPVVAEDGP